jgi:hypothetical protein
MLGQRQKAAAAELAQWWDGIRQGGIGSHAVLVAAPAGWGRSTVLDQLSEIISRTDAPASLVVRVSGRSLPDGAAQQAAALRDGLLEAGVRRQAATLLCRGLMRTTSRLGPARLLGSGIFGTISVLLASLAAAAAGSTADHCPASEDGAAARAARTVAAVSASQPVAVLIDDADCLETGLAVTMIENLIDHHDSQVLVIAAVDLGSDLAAALTYRARYGLTAGRVHRASADPRMGRQSRAQLAGELSPHLTQAQAQQLARGTRTFAEVFRAAGSGRLS